MKTPLLAGLAIVVLLGADAPQEDVKKEIAKLQGTWKSVKAERRGESRDDNGDARMTFSGENFTITIGGETKYKGKFKIDPSKQPKQIDMMITESHTEAHKDKTAVGIYAVEADTLKWCSDEPGNADRPKAFATNADSKLLFVTFKRDK